MSKNRGGLVGLKHDLSSPKTTCQIRSDESDRSDRRCQLKALVPISSAVSFFVDSSHSAAARSDSSVTGPETAAQPQHKAHHVRIKYSITPAAVDHSSSAFNQYSD